MKYYADLHIHSPFAKGASPRMSFRTIEKTASEKGIALVGTGDCLHPNWMEQIDQMLIEDLDSGLLVYDDGRSKIKFIPTVEVNCEDGRKRIHMLLVFKNMPTVRKVRKRLEKYGRMGDGRPTLKMKPGELVDLAKGDFDEVIVIAAHLLTPWTGAMGDKNRYDAIHEAIDPLPDAVETGISADKRMVMSIGDMGSITICSFSDAHSPENIGREVTVFNGVPSWKTVRDGIASHKIDTIEYPPPLGKYHYSGHRKCKISVPPGGRALCPVCHRRITMGVEQRLEDLMSLKTPLKEKYMVPLRKLIQLRGEGEYADTDVNKLYMSAISQAPEIELLVNKSLMSVNLDKRMKDLIETVRSQQLCIIPGYDGKAGELVNTRKLLWDLVGKADNLFQSKKDHKRVWGQAEKLQELMKNGAMTITQEEHERFLLRRVPEPV